MKRCSYCAEEIQDEAVKCKHCGSMVSGRDATGLDASLRAGEPSSRYDTLDAAVTQSGHANVLAGQYRIIKKLGEGGMGIVYLAEDMELADRSVAIKVLPPLLSKNTRAVENLRREALTAIGLNHPNIIRLYGFHSDDEIKFLVMEYIEGQTLEETLTQRSDHRLGLPESIRVVEQVAAALDYAHGQSPAVVHRDLKPSNIMVDRSGNAKVLDFGIAREMKDSYTRVTGQQTSGTLPYMSPEQLRGKNAEPSMDIYALGAVCYECLSGHTPFHTGDLGYQIIHETPPKLDNVPEHVNAAMQKVLAKEPQGRPRSAGEFARLLSGGKPVDSPRPQRQPAPVSASRQARKPAPAKPKQPAAPRPTGRKRKRSPLRALFLFVFLAVVAVGGILFRHEAMSVLEGFYPVPRHRWVPSESQRAFAESTGLPLEHTISLGNGITMEFVLIPPGSLRTASTDSDGYADYGKGLEDAVTVCGPFYFSKYEVTQAQWRQIMGTTVQQQRSEAGVDLPLHGRGDNYPMCFVTWDEADEFCMDLSDRCGTYFRLPTEAEWEYACRAESPGDYFFESYGTAGDLGEFAWTGANSGSRAHPIGQKRPNPWGLYDMYGNVAEWCADWLDPHETGAAYSAFADSDKGLFKGSSFDEEETWARVVRGGHFESAPDEARSAYRDQTDPDESGPATGFRVIFDGFDFYEEPGSLSEPSKF